MAACDTALIPIFSTVDDNPQTLTVRKSMATFLISRASGRDRHLETELLFAGLDLQLTMPMSGTMRTGMVSPTLPT